MTHLRPLVPHFLRAARRCKGGPDPPSGLEKFSHFLTCNNKTENGHKVEDLLSLERRVRDSTDVIVKSIQDYGFSNVFLSFNGGKDSVVALHLYRIASKFILKQSDKLQAVFFKDPRKREFPEITHFIHTVTEKYQLNLRYVNEDWTGGIANFSQGTAFIMGSRVSDNSGPMHDIMDSKMGNFSFVRVNPILNWTYGQVWDFLRYFNLDYCTLYDQGYTSIGTMEDSVPNPSLRSGDAYTPAYTLKDWRLERLGRVTPSTTRSSNSEPMDVNESVQKTSWMTLIAVTKRNSAEMGYYEDDYIKYFAPKTRQPASQSLYTFMRVTWNRKLIGEFVNTFPNQTVQFVNLGCGMDTASLWVHANFPKAVCYDLDLEFQMKVKVDIIKENKELLGLFPNCATTRSSLHSDRYHIVPCDLRNVDELDRLFEFGFSSDLPTIFLSEFVLTYLENHLSNKVIGKLRQMTRPPSILIYHEIKNNTPLFTIHGYPTLEDQIKRYKGLGWDDLLVLEYLSVYNYMIGEEERKRLLDLEHFSDFSTLSILTYAPVVGVAVKGCPTEAFSKLLVKDGGGGLLPEFDNGEMRTEFNEDDFNRVVEHLEHVILNLDSRECQEFINKFK